MFRNKKGEVGIGALIMVFIGVIVGLVILASTFPTIGQTTQTVLQNNQTITFPNSGQSVVLNGQAASAVTVINRSGSVVPASNYNITNYDTTTGTFRVLLTANAGSTFYGNSTNVSYTYEPVGYVTDSGSRSIIGLIPLLSAIAIALFVLGVAYTKGLIELDIFGR